MGGRSDESRSLEPGFRRAAGRLATGAAIALGLLGAASLGAQEDAIGRIESVEGEAWVESGGVRRAAEAGQPFRLRDVLVTGADGSLSLVFEDDSVYTLDPGTTIAVERFQFGKTGEPPSFLTRISHGLLSGLSGLIARLSPGAATVEAPVNTMAIRGTRFVIRVVPEGASPSPATADFEDLPRGARVAAVFGREAEGGRLGPILVWASARGQPDRQGANAAVVFDSSNPGVGDPDLGSPHRDFGGPGAGSAGSRGGRYANREALGKVLIVSRNLSDRDGDGRVDEPDDDPRRGASITFDFSRLRQVTVSAITLLDHDEEGGALELLDAEGETLRRVELPDTGDNGVTRLDLGRTGGVRWLRVALAGSGAVDRLEFEAVPRSYAVLLEESDGSVGAIDVRGAGQVAALSSPLAAAYLEPSVAEFDATAGEVDAVFGELLARAPAPPSRFTLHFELDSTELTDESRTVLAELLAALGARPAAEIRIEGHADRSGDFEHNDVLAHRRAEAVFQEIAAAGIGTRSVEVRSYGETRPAVPTPDGVREAANRRVEVRVR